MRPNGRRGWALTSALSLTGAAGAPAPAAADDTPSFLTRLHQVAPPPVVIHAPAAPPPVPPVDLDLFPVWIIFGVMAAQASVPPVLHLGGVPASPEESVPDDDGEGPSFLEILRKREKAAGEFIFTNGSFTAFFSFNADAMTQSGEAFYSDTQGAGQRWYRVRVTAVEVHGNECSFSGPIVETNVADWEVFSIQFWATDRGRNNDGFAYECYLTSGDLPFDDPPDGEYPLDAGAIEVGK